ncbi:DUF2059 domain-containing protein [Planctobacterium marinum]|uniref:DUF2059 domain-containing protein n=1 Tax=Planctobacterium marinum TaxID=1631968 RepID=A0AA48KRG2_9ALTE|nr:hypothetical protein MACH26_09100 [Planctobacterium marinum]
MRRLLISLIGLSLLGSSQVLSASTQDEEHKMQLVERLFEVYFADSIKDSMRNSVTQSVEREKERLKLDFPLEQYNGILQDYLQQYEALQIERQESYASLSGLKQHYADYYTASELEQLIAFYESDLGKKRVNFQPSSTNKKNFKTQQEEYWDALTALKEELSFNLRKAGGSWEKYLHTTPPMRAIERSEALHHLGKGVEGVFEFKIKAAAVANGWLYLNSEKDYRDRRCLTVKIPEIFIDELRASYGYDLEKELPGLSLMAKGEAKRHTIRAMGPGNKPSFPYYQTHVTLDSLEDLLLSPKRD